MSKVLVAEDEPGLLECFSELVKDLGHECLVAHDGFEAIELARAHEPDLVVTDYMMPGCTGVDVVRALRKEAKLARVPTILMSTGRPPEEERRLPWRFLSKPLSLEELEHTIREALGDGEAEGAVSERKSHPPRDVSELTLAREDMLNWVAHEIKSPLSAAVSATQLAMRKAKRGEEPAALERYLVMTARQLTRMDELVNSILDAAQLKDGRLKLDEESIELAPWLQKIVEFWEDLQPDHEFTIEDGHGHIVVGDSERLRQILDNLISNAIKYGRPSKRIRIHVEARDEQVLIHVQDFGPGIPSTELGSIFNRFHRVAGQGGRGHGLGLYIADALARLHGGRLSVTSEVGRGSIFTLALPAPSGASGQSDP